MTASAATTLGRTGPRPPLRERPMGSLATRAPNVRAVLLRPVVTLLPAVATSLYTLLSVGPEARDAMFAHVAEDSARLDGARNRVMAQLTGLPEQDRATAIRVAQSAALLGRLVLAVARVAAQGGTGRIPPGTADLAKVVVEITEQVAAVDLGDLPAQRPSRRPSVADALAQLHEASNQLDQVMWRLTGGDRQARSVRVHTSASRSENRSGVHPTRCSATK